MQPGATSINRRASNRLERLACLLLILLGFLSFAYSWVSLISLRPARAGQGLCWKIFATLLQGRIISDSSPERRRVRPPTEEKIGPALSSSHCKHSFRVHDGGGPLLGAVNEPMHVRPHDRPS